MSEETSYLSEQLKQVKQEGKSLVYADESGSETKVIDVMGMREKVKPSLGSSQVNARGR